MSDMAAAAARALRDSGEYVVVTGRSSPRLSPLVDAARRHVVSPGLTTRLDVAAGVELGGHRAVTVVDAGCDFTTGHGGVAFTESAQAARGALRGGWSVVQPWRGQDVASLLAGAPRPTVVLLGADDGPEPAAAAHALPPRSLRRWQEGDLATVVASGAAVGPLVRIGGRLEARGVSVAVVEIAVLTGPAHEPLVGGDALYVGRPEAAALIAKGRWPEEMQRVAVSGAEDADLVGQVLSNIRTA